MDGINNKIRENESLCVLKKLGVKKSQISFIGKELSIPDLALKDHLISAFLKCKSLNSIMIREYRNRKYF